MSEQQDTISPLESVSNASRRKSRPGKAQRMAARGSFSQASAVTSPTSMTSAQEFSSKMVFAPTPQPGKFPVVFPSGAGEPSRDSFMAVDGKSLDACLTSNPGNYLNSARYAEFSTNAGVTDNTFAQELTVSSLLGIAQQIVHAHQNMGLPIGDFSAVSTTEMFNPSAVRSIIHQYGEFSVESLGTRFLYSSYIDEVTALVRTAFRVNATPNGVSTILQEHWLPTRVGDERTNFIIASALKQYLEGKGLSLKLDVIRASLFKEAPAVFNIAKAVLADPDKNIFDGLFRPWKDKEQFKNAFPPSVLDSLGLTWKNRDVQRIVFNIVPKIHFPELAESWLRRKTTMMKFFSCGTGVAEKTNACGSPTQLAEVRVTAGVTVVNATVAVSAPEFSLCACFPPTAVYPFGAEKNVVLTTSLSPKVRATEFMQLDWL